MKLAVIDATKAATYFFAMGDERAPKALKTQTLENREGDRLRYQEHSCGE